MYIHVILVTALTISFTELVNEKSHLARSQCYIYDYVIPIAQSYQVLRYSPSPFARIRHEDCDMRASSTHRGMQRGALHMHTSVPEMIARQKLNRRQGESLRSLNSMSSRYGNRNDVVMSEAERRERYSEKHFMIRTRCYATLHSHI